MPDKTVHFSVTTTDNTIPSKIAGRRSELPNNIKIESSRTRMHEAAGPPETYEFEITVAGILDLFALRTTGDTLSKYLFNILKSGSDSKVKVNIEGSEAQLDKYVIRRIVFEKLDEALSYCRVEKLRDWLTENNVKEGLGELGKDCRWPRGLVPKLPAPTLVQATVKVKNQTKTFLLCEKCCEYCRQQGLLG